MIRANPSRRLRFQTWTSAPIKSPECSRRLFGVPACNRQSLATTLIVRSSSARQIMARSASRFENQASFITRARRFGQAFHLGTRRSSRPKDFVRLNAPGDRFEHGAARPHLVRQGRQAERRAFLGVTLLRLIQWQRCTLFAGNTTPTPSAVVQLACLIVLSDDFEISSSPP